MSTGFDARLFSAALRTRRGERGLREVAAEIGVSASTLSRVENSETPDMETFLILCTWVGWPTSAFFASRQGRDTVQLVEQALREDGVLSTEVVDAFLVLLQAVRQCATGSMRRWPQQKWRMP
jgi:transcriptional regulator with XRE-family HTH domain